MLEKRSAPTSLILSTKEPSKHRLTERSLSDMASIKSASLSQQQLASDGQAPGTELINSKFNELAKKILEELSNSQYSKEFFHALDCIIKEPAAKSLAARRTSTASSISKQVHNQSIGTSNDRKRLVRRRFKASDNSQDSSTSELTLSNTSNNNNNQRSISKHQPANNRQQLVSSLSLVNSQKSIIPVMCASENGSVGPKRSATQSSASHLQQGPHKLARSATSAGEMLSKLKTNLSRLTTSGHQSTVSSQMANGRASGLGGVVDGQVHNSLSSANNSRRIKANSFEEKDDMESSDGEEEEEMTFDEELDDADDSCEEDRTKFFSSNSSTRRATNSSQYKAPHQTAPLAKSKTITDATSINRVTKSAASSEVPSNQKSVLKTSQVLQQKNQINQNLSNARKQVVETDKIRNNPINRSHTITSTKGVAAHLEKLAKERASYNSNNNNNSITGSSHNKEPRSMIFNERDIGSLYKPNMNYSTSVLGNHRLSDDDEIIIIPTQSPSIMSTSPDGDNVDDGSERFSISRTKSFWEKLSKGNNKHGSLPNEDASDSLIVSNNNNNNNRLSTASATGGHNNIYEKPMVVRGGAGGKGNQGFLDRMDSTGGSNSNYNGSSSGDENFTSYTNPTNPTIRHLQEMNRQNRFRQTR